MNAGGQATWWNPGSRCDRAGSTRAISRMLPSSAWWALWYGGLRANPRESAITSAFSFDQNCSTVSPHGVPARNRRRTARPDWPNRWPGRFLIAYRVPVIWAGTHSTSVWRAHGWHACPARSRATLPASRHARSTSIGSSSSRPPR